MAGLQQYGKVVMHENTSGDDVFTVVAAKCFTINLRIFEALTRVRWRTPNRQQRKEAYFDTVAFHCSQTRKRHVQGEARMFLDAFTCKLGISPIFFVRLGL